MGSSARTLRCRCTLERSPGQLRLKIDSNERLIWPWSQIGQDSADTWAGLPAPSTLRARTRDVREGALTATRRGSLRGATLRRYRRATSQAGREMREARPRRSDVAGRRSMLTKAGRRHKVRGSASVLQLALNVCSPTSTGWRPASYSPPSPFSNRERRHLHSGLDVERGHLVWVDSNRLGYVVVAGISDTMHDEL